MQRLRLGSASWIREFIQASVKRTCEQRMLLRLCCVLLVAEGRSCYEVARWFGEDPRTIERWVHALQGQGVEGLREHHAGGRPGKLAADQVERVVIDLQQPPRLCGYPDQRWSGRRLAQHLEGHYGIKLSARQCQRMMRRLAGGDPPRAA